MKVFSPSSRQDFSFCPRMWWLRKQGWVSKQVGYPELCAWGGQAVSEAMDVWNKRRIAQLPVDLDELTLIGVNALQKTHQTVLAQGRSVVGLKDREFLEQLPQHVKTAIKVLWEANPLKGHEVIGSEIVYSEWGDMRLDVVSRNPQGELVVDDYKCKFGSFDVAWTDREFEKHFDGEQRLYYTAMTGASLFGIILVLIQPHSKHKPAKPHVIRRVSRVQPHEHAMWENDARLDWAQMEQTLKQTNGWAVRGKAAPHANQYGDCAYRGACVEDGLDEARMGVRYIQINSTKGVVK